MVFFIEFFLNLAEISFQSKFQKNHQVLLGGTLQVVQRLEYVLDLLQDKHYPDKHYSAYLAKYKA